MGIPGSHTKFRIVTTNITATCLCIFFMKKYIEGGAVPNTILLVIFLILATMISIGTFILRPLTKASIISNSIPNAPISLAIGLIFVKDIGLLGLILVILIPLLIVSAKNLLAEAANEPS